MKTLAKSKTADAFTAVSTLAEEFGPPGWSHDCFYLLGTDSGQGSGAFGPPRKAGPCELTSASAIAGKHRPVSLAWE